MQLLVDDGVTSRGNRKTMINPNYLHVGIGVSDHKEEGKVIVIVYAAQVVSKGINVA
jgi:uncharacterized protein YkwD